MVVMGCRKEIQIQSSANLCWRNMLIYVFVTSFLLSGTSRAGETSVVPVGLDQSFEQVQRHFDEGEYNEAVRIAEAIVEGQDKGSGNQSYQRAVAIHNLAVLQQLTANLTQSEQNFKRSISMIEAVRGVFSPLMIPSLNHLAILCYQTDRLSESLDLLRRSQHITQRSHGVYSLDQLETLDWISKVLVASRESLQADVQERFYYKIHEENFGKLDPRTVPAMSRLGDWLQSSGQYREALRVYRRAISVIEQDDSSSELRVLPLLNEISSNLYLMGVCCPEKPLQRVVDIVVADPTTDRIDEVEAMIRLADMYLLRAHSRKASKLYKRAWNRMIGANSSAGLIDADPSRLGFNDPSPLGLVGASAVVEAYQKMKHRGAPLSLTAELIHVELRDPGQRGFSTAASVDSLDRVLIGSPMPLCYSHVVNLVPRRRRDEIPSYYMDLDFSVDSNGRVVSIKVDSSNTPWRLIGYVKNLLRSIRYRPRMENGEPVTTDHVVLRQTFAAMASGSADGDAEFSASATIRGCSMVAGID